VTSGLQRRTSNCASRNSDTGAARSRAPAGEVDGTAASRQFRAWLDGGRVPAGLFRWCTGACLRGV